MLEQGLVSLLTANEGVNALVADRIYPVQGPPANPTYPYVTYQAVTAVSDYTMDGKEVRRKRLQFDCWATSSLANLNILTALRNALTGLTVLLADGTSLLFTTRENEIANFDNDSKSYRSLCEYEFLFVEP